MTEGGLTAALVFLCTEANENGAPRRRRFLEKQKNSEGMKVRTAFVVIIMAEQDEFQVNLML
jgi:hypothetical protein